jgi:hypothetical protein
VFNDVASQIINANGADGISDIEGKVARVATSKLGNERVSMELMGSATRLRQGYGAPSIEGKVARVVTSKRGKRASFNHGIMR